MSKLLKQNNLEIWKKAMRVATGTDTVYVPVKTFDAIVIAGSQNPNTLTCFVNSTDFSINNLEVRYMVCISDGEIDVPADDSNVTVAMSQFTDPYIVKSSELNSKNLVIGDTEISLVNGNILIQQGGITITLSNNKIGIKNGSQDFKTIMDTHFNNLFAMTFTNGAGTTSPANNLSDLQQDKENFDELWQ